MILNDKADIIFANSSPELCIPPSDQCESLGTPNILVDCPWQPWYFKSEPPADGWKWSVLMFWGVDDLVANFLDIWSKIPTNKSVGALWPNDPDGNAFRGLFPEPLQEAGYSIVDPGGYPPALEDFTALISEFKTAGVEIVTGCPIPPDFTNFWSQASQQGLTVKICTIAKAMLFPASANALGDIGVGVTTELWWHRKYPFKSSLTGETCEQMAADYEERTGEQWCSPLLHYVLMEVAVDALKRVNDVDSKEAIMEAIFATKLDTLGGPIDFSAPVDENGNHPVPNVSKTPQATAQWTKGTEWPYELVIIGNARAPMVQPEAEVQPMA
jgi:branched-chain amino acid transport system substrate-binding protein